MRKLRSILQTVKNVVPMYIISCNITNIDIRHFIDTQQTLNNYINLKKNNYNLLAR